MKMQLITEKQQLLPYLTLFKAAQVMSVDTETTGLDPHADKLRLIQLAVKGLPVLVIDCFRFLPEGFRVLADLFSSKTVKIFHNAKFDLQFFAAVGLYPYPIYDTMLAAQLLRSSGGPERVSLKAVAAHYLNVELEKEYQASDWSGRLHSAQLEYAALDAEILLRLWDHMVDDIRQNGLSNIARIEMRCVQALAYMEYGGILLDGEKWRALTLRTERERDDALEALYAYTGPPIRQTTLWGHDEVYSQNLESNHYVVQLLRKNGIPVTATSKFDLFPYRDHPLVATLTAYRKASKSLSSFLYPIVGMASPVTGRLHPKYHQISAWSGRMSCDSPNIQQIPREAAFRECFIAARGNKLVVADYSQIELRVAAELADDERMLWAYREGQDLHRLTASLILEKPIEQITKQERQAAKAVNFGLVFGMGPGGLKRYAEQTYGAYMTIEQATLFRKRYFEAYTGISRWHETLKQSPPSEGRTLAGRKFLYPEKAALPITTNTPVQGTAADIIKKALGLLVRRLPVRAKLVAVVHDEILLEAPEDEANSVAEILRAVMEEAGGAILKRVPVVAEVCIADSWAEK